jgi:putative DNA primase/helicase
LADEALKLPIDYEKQLSKMYNIVMSESSESDRAKEALEAVMSWAFSNKESFYGRYESDRKPFSGCLGAWSKNKNWEKISFLPHTLGKFLKDNGFEPKAIYRTWKDKGWLELDKDEKSFQKKVTIDNERQRCVVVLREAVNEIMGDEVGQLGEGWTDNY